MAGVKLKETTFENTKLNTVLLNWKEVYYTNCRHLSGSGSREKAQQKMVEELSKKK